MLKTIGGKSIMKTFMYDKIFNGLLCLI